jgi:CRISPR/Cas system-associated protein Cas10 (large subunit of type III CRISPR-Cas system)
VLVSAVGTVLAVLGALGGVWLGVRATRFQRREQRQEEALAAVRAALAKVMAPADILFMTWGSGMDLEPEFDAVFKAVEELTKVWDSLWLVDIVDPDVLDVINWVREDVQPLVGSEHRPYDERREKLEHFHRTVLAARYLVEQKLLEPRSWKDSVSVLEGHEFMQSRHRLQQGAYEERRKEDAERWPPGTNHPYH